MGDDRSSTWPTVIECGRDPRARVRCRQNHRSGSRWPGQPRSCPTTSVSSSIGGAGGQPYCEHAQRGQDCTPWRVTPDPRITARDGQALGSDPLRPLSCPRPAGGSSPPLGTSSLPCRPVVFDATIDRFVELARVVPPRSAGRGRQIGISRGNSEPNKPGRRGRPPGTRAAELSAGRDRPQSQRLSTPFDRAIVPGVGRVGECFQDPESSGTADREGSRLLRKPWAPAPAHCYVDLLQGMADRLGIDLELLADRDTRESRGVQNRLVRCRGSGHALVSIPRGTREEPSGCPANRVLAGQQDRRRSGQTAGNEPLRPLGWNPALDLS